MKKILSLILTLTLFLTILCSCDDQDVSPPSDSKLSSESTADLSSGTDPVVTEPTETDPAETEPTETDPVVTDPTETDPVVTDPVETGCPHSHTVSKNAASASCTVDGYSGDTVCDSCGEILQKGTVVPATGHTGTVRNAVKATCTSDGYSGDTVCSVCGEILEQGAVIPATGHTYVISGASGASCTTNGYTGDKICSSCGHVSEQGTVIPATGHTTEIRNRKEASMKSEGYTGDTVCTKCGEIVEKGTAIPKIEIPHIAHNFPDLEQTMLRCINAERAKAGLPALTFYEDVYAYSMIRAKEIITTFSHSRPDGTMYSEEMEEYVSADEYWIGENIAYSGTDGTFNVAEYMVELYMNSPLHRANILRPDFTAVSIAFYYDETTGIYYNVQSFVGFH